MLKRRGCSGEFQNGSFSPPPVRSTRFFSEMHCENQVEPLEVKRTEVWDLWSFNSRSCPHGASSIHQLQFRLLTPPVLVPRRFQWVSAPVSCDSLNLPVGLFNLGSSGSPYDLTSYRSKESCCFFGLFRAGISPSMTAGDCQVDCRALSQQRTRNDFGPPPRDIEPLPSRGPGPAPSRSTPTSVPLVHAKPGLAIILMSNPVLLTQGLDFPARAGLYLDPGPWSGDEQT